jgi:hypothetical protein
MMIDEQLSRAHHNNIQRYRHLLRTSLIEFERQFVERRLSEEQSKLEILEACLPNDHHPSRSPGLDGRLGLTSRRRRSGSHLTPAYASSRT